MGSFYEMVRSTFDIAKPLAFGEKFYLATVGILVVMSTIGRLPLGNLGRLARYCVSERLSLGDALENFFTRLRVMIVNCSRLPDHNVFILDDRPGGIYTSTGHRLFLPLDVRANGLWHNLFDCPRFSLGFISVRQRISFGQTFVNVRRAIRFCLVFVDIRSISDITSIITHRNIILIFDNFFLVISLLANTARQLSFGLPSITLDRLMDIDSGKPKPLIWLQCDNSSH